MKIQQLNWFSRPTAPESIAIEKSLGARAAHGFDELGAVKTRRGQQPVQ